MTVKDKKPELVSAAGSWSSLNSALEAGADSVYFGIKGLNMRNFASNFDISEIKKIMGSLHENNKKGYLALNVIVYNREIPKIKSILKEAKNSSVDGVILWDMAVFSLARELGLNIHLSTQASVSNFLALKSYFLAGARRIVLARECSASDIKKIISEIKKEKINCQIETFVHGAVCISISGRCFLSEHSFFKSANRGECLQPCRREFSIIDSDGESQYVLGKDYLLSSKDLCTIDFIDKLISAGIDAFKIEGRSRSPEYIKVVTSAYRQAIDAYFNGKLDRPLKNKLMKSIESVYNRGFFKGFYQGKIENSISKELNNTYEKIYAGKVIKFYKKISVAEVLIQNEGLKKGDAVVCMGRHTPASFAVINDIQMNHDFVDKIERGQKGGVRLPFVLKANDKIFIWRKKF